MTPRNCRNKFKFDPVDGLFELGSVLPAGSVFPYDFGFVPGTVAADGEEALVLIDEQAPDLVVLDWMLPKVSGVEVCRRLRARPSGVLGEKRARGLGTCELGQAPQSAPDAVR